MGSLAESAHPPSPLSVPKCSLIVGAPVLAEVEVIRRRMAPRCETTGREKADFNGRWRPGETQQKLSKIPFGFRRHTGVCDDQQVHIASARVEAPYCERAVEIHTNEIPAERARNGTDAGRDLLPHRFRRVIPYASSHEDPLGCRRDGYRIGEFAQRQEGTLRVGGSGRDCRHNAHVALKTHARTRRFRASSGDPVVPPWRRTSMSYEAIRRKSHVG